MESFLQMKSKNALKAVKNSLFLFCFLCIAGGGICINTSFAPINARDLGFFNNNI